MTIFLFRRTLLVCLVGLCPLAFAQKLPKDSVTTVPVDQQVQAAALADLLPQISPKSPNAAAFSRYDEQPVNLFSGLPTIEIPLYEIQAGSIRLPIKLTYHAGGHKVTDAASWVGLGWSLQPGRAITRQQRGVPDEAQSIGLLDRTVILDPYSYFNTPSCYNEDVRYYYQRLATGQLDAERDLFTVQLPGMTNQFILRSQTDAQWLSPEVSRVSFSRAANAFILLDPQGIRYEFATPEITDGGYANAWLINSVQAHQTTDRVVINYAAATNYQRTHQITESQTINDSFTGLLPDGASFPQLRKR